MEANGVGEGGEPEGAEGRPQGADSGSERDEEVPELVVDVVRE